MVCGAGKHSHSDGKGGYTGCHDISQHHKNPVTQQAHEMALSNPDLNRREADYRETLSRDRTVRERQAVVERGSRPAKLLHVLGKDDLVGKDYSQLLSSALRDVKNLKMFRRIFPITSALGGLERMNSYIDRMADNYATEDEVKGFTEVWGALDKQLSKSSTPEEVEATIKDLREKQKYLEENPKIRRKGSAQHGAYVALTQFLHDYDRDSKILAEANKRLISQNTKEAMQLVKKLPPGMRLSVSEWISARTNDTEGDVDVAGLIQQYTDALPEDKRKNGRHMLSVYVKYVEDVRNGKERSPELEEKIKGFFASTSKYAPSTQEKLKRLRDTRKKVINPSSKPSSQ